MLPFDECCCGLYLESGLLQREVNPDYLHYGTQVQAAHTAGSPMRRALLDETNGLESDTYSEGDSTLTENPVRSYVAPSKYSGKMRLFVQSLYGSSYADYSASGSDLLLDTLTLDYKLPTAGLFTASGFEYFIIIGGTTDFKFYEVELSPLAVLVRAWLAANYGSLTDDEIAHHEAYILSTASVGKLIATKSVSIPSGSPLAYGWHYNSDGTKASMVLVVQNCSGSNTSQTTTATIAYVASPEDFTVSIASGSSSSFTFPKGTASSMWVPDHINSGMVTRVLDCCPDVFDDTATYNVGLYCWYDSDDILQTLNWNSSGTTSNTDTGLVGTHMVCGDGSGTHKREMTYGGRNNCGFSLGGSYAGTTAADATYWEKNTSITLDSGYTDQACNTGYPGSVWVGHSCPDDDQNKQDIADALDAAGASGYFRRVYNGSGSQDFIHYTNGQRGHSSLCIIPWDNAEAVYLGLYQYDYHPSAMNGHDSSATGIIVKADFGANMGSPDYCSNKTIVYSNLPFWAGTGYWSGGSWTSWANNPETVVEDYQPWSKSSAWYVEDLTFDFIDKDATVVNVQASSASGATPTLLDATGWGGFWSPPSCEEDPTHPHSVLAKQSAHYLSYFIETNTTGDTDQSDSLPAVTSPTFVGYS